MLDPQTAGDKCMDNQFGTPNTEQRKGPRRKKEDRRQAIRFEPSKTNRRKHRGRRSCDGDVWDKHEG